MTKNVMSGMQTWLDNSIKNYEEMDKGLEGINSNNTKMDFKKILKSTKKIMKAIHS